MLPTRLPGFRSLRCCALAALLVVASNAAAQPPNPFGLPGRAGTPPAQPPKAPAPAPQLPPSSRVIARVEGRPITQEAFDRVAEPYLEQVKAQLKDAFDDRLRAVARRNVMQELIRRDVLMVLAQRRGIPVTDADVDRLLSQDATFLTNGKFDPTKLNQFKFSPGSTYPVLLPHLRELAAAARLDSATRARLTPGREAVRKEWTDRNEQVRFQYLPMALRDIPLEPEATGAEQAEFYARHPDLFRRKARANVRYLWLALPPPGDSLRASAEAAALARARRMADSLRSGIPLDSLGSRSGEVLETGFVDLPPTRLPRLGVVPELAAAMARAESDSTVHVLAPVVAGNRVLVCEIAGVQPAVLPPLAEVRAEVKRQADLDKRRTMLETERRAWYADHPDSFRTPRARVTRVVMRDAARGARVWRDLLENWSKGRDVRSLARRAEARVETLTIVAGAFPDSIFSAPLVDSILAGVPEVGPGGVRGPRTSGAGAVAWRVDAFEPDYVPDYESIRARVELAYQEEKQRREEAEALAYFEGHRADYRTPLRLVADYILVKIPPLDSVKVPEADERRYYRAHADQFRREEEVHARHILISTRSDPSPEGLKRAETLADSLLGLIHGGADFADLARRYSQDPGSASQGGDLGFFPRGRMVPEFNDAAFALKPGQVSGVVKTAFGFHIIRVDERHEAGLRDFEEVKAAIRGELAQAAADSMARRRAESARRRIARGAYARGVALEFDSLRTSPPFAAGEPVPSVGWVQGLFDDLASLPVGRWAPRIYRAGSAYVLAMCAQRIPAGPAEFAEVRTRVMEDMRNAKRRAILDERIAAIRAALAAGASLDSASAPYGGLRDSGYLMRTSGIVPGLGLEPRAIEAAFALEPGQTTDTLTTSVGVAWIRTEEKRKAPGADFDRDAPALEQEMLAKAYGEWLEREKKTMKIQILRADLRPETAAAASGAGAGTPARRAAAPATARPRKPPRPAAGHN